MTSPRWTLQGSNVIIPETFHIRSHAPLNPVTTLTATVFVRTGAPLPDVMEIYNAPLRQREYITREEYVVKYGMADADLQLMEQFASTFGLDVKSVDRISCAVVLEGTVGDWNKACGIEWTCLEETKCVKGHAYRGNLTFPEYLKDVVEAVVSFEFPDGHVHRKSPHKHAVVADEATEAAQGITGYWATEMADMYNFPKGKHGAGQTVGIWEYNAAFSTKDLEAYFKAAKVQMPSIKAVEMDGYVPPKVASEAGAPYQETNLDIQVAGAIANEAEFLVYLFPGNTTYATGIYQILFDENHSVDVLSISYGECELLVPECEQRISNRAMQVAALLGVTVTVSSGDGGSPTRDSAAIGMQVAAVNYPAVSPYALACGGVHTEAADGAITSESVWNQLNQCVWSSVGGRSVIFDVPDYQKDVDLPPNANFVKVPKQGRAVPDVAANAALLTGFYVYIREKRTTVGGTSAAAPLWAALIAIMNSALGRNVGFIHPHLYQLQRSDAFVSITKGNNGAYQAMDLYDCCTGLGRPNGEALMEQLGED